MSDIIDVQRLFAEQGEHLFVNLYQRHKEEFIHWAIKSFDCDREIAKECFQESVTVFYQKVQNGSLNEIQSSIKTYLFGIGRNFLLRHFRRKKKTDSWDESFLDVLVDKAPTLTELTVEERKVADHLLSLDTNCRELLILFFYKNFAVDAIMTTMGYKSEHVVRSKKYKCLRKLEKLLNTAK